MAMSAGSLATFFAWSAAATTFAAAVLSVLALHYRNSAAAEKDLEMAAIRLEAAKAHERIAELNVQAESARKDTEQARIQLEQLRFPRRVNFEKLKETLQSVPPQSFEVLYDSGAPDASTLASQISVSLRSIGWRTSQKLPAPLTPQVGPPGLQDIWHLLPLTQQAGGEPWGLGVLTNKSSVDENEALGRAVAHGLLHSVSGPIQQVSHGSNGTMPADSVRIIVGPKLP